MIIQEFSFGNFRSFKDIQTLNMASAKIKSKLASVDESNLIKNVKYKDISFLKSKAIYGANASGKSNIVKAFLAFIHIVRQSVKDEKVLSLVEPFQLSTKSSNEPSFFQLIFWIDGTRYRYGFELDVSKIHAEWLFAKPGARELPFFIRDNQKIIEIDKTNFGEGSKLLKLFDANTDENEIFRENSLFLSSISSLGFGKLSKEIVDNISLIFVINGLGQSGLYSYAVESLNDWNRKKYIVDFLKYGDTGIEDLESLDLKQESEKKNESKEDLNQRLIFSFRKKYDEKTKLRKSFPFPFRLIESEGTVKLFELAPLVYEALKENRPLIIDEFDARLHPLLTKKIVELFHSKQNTGSQLIFITHDTNLLSADFIRRDQIEFVEKDRYGASHMYPLVQFKGIRNNASFEKDYINGKYGAIPFLGDFKKLLSFEDHA